MRQQRSFAQNQFAHGFEIVKRGFVAEMLQGGTHFGECELRLVPETEEGFGAAELFAGTGDFENFVRSHRVRGGLAGIAAEGAVAAIVAAEIREWKKNFA